VVPPSDKIDNSVFHLQNQSRPLHSNAHVFKIPTPVCTIFGTVEHRDILNIPVTSLHQLPNTKCCHLAKDKHSLFSYYKQLKSDLVEPFLLHGSVKMSYKIDFMNIIVALKICLICPLFHAKCIRDVMLPFADASCSWDLVSGLAAY